MRLFIRFRGNVAPPDIYVMNYKLGQRTSGANRLICRELIPQKYVRLIFKLGKRYFLKVLLSFTRINVQTVMLVLSPVMTSVRPGPRYVMHGHSSLLHK